MICNKNECTGCFACYNVCPKNAINMIEDKCGYIYPQIDDKKCINCKLCEKICPAINKVKFNAPIKCYAGKVKDIQKLAMATSGGIATQISEYFIDNNGIVYGASFVKNCGIEHIRVDNKKELDKLRGSKYVHSYIKDSYKLVKKDLTDNKNVLFIGTPCQIAGLKKYLMKEYENLYTIDVICHGVPSQKFLQNEIYRIREDLNIDRVNFRDKKYNERTFSIVKNDIDVFKEQWEQSPYFYTFMKSIICRENCYNCNYAKSERCSDLTIGDFWGLKEDSKFYNEKNKGVSVLLPCTEKGIELIKNISNLILLEERNINEAIDGNDQLKFPALKNDKAEKFKKCYQGDFYKTYKKVMKKNYYKQRIKSNYIVAKVLKLRKGLNNGKK